MAEVKKLKKLKISENIFLFIRLGTHLRDPDRKSGKDRCTEVIYALVSMSSKAICLE